MATWYVDFENGNDAAAGTSFATRRKSLTALTSGLGLAAGDTIRVMGKTMGSLGSATWTDNTRTVILASPLTANISLCETAWTASANVTATADTTRKQGSFSNKMVVAGAFTTGVIAYSALGAVTDFSAYQQISFWIRSSVAIAASVLQIQLCSDVAGAVPVNSMTITLPIARTSQWHVMTIDNGAALGSSIQSVNITALSDPGATDLYLDNIIACKASGSADALTLNSVIGKESVAEPCRWPIMSINGTTVEIGGNETNVLPSAQKTWRGTTETVTTYHFPTVRVIPPADENPVNIKTTMQVTGTGALPITVSGGWNSTDMSTQTGESMLDFANGRGNGFHTGALKFINYEKISAVRCVTGWSGSINCSITDAHFISGDIALYYVDASKNGNFVNNIRVTCYSWGVYQYSGVNNEIRNIFFQGISGGALYFTYGVDLRITGSRNVFKDVTSGIISLQFGNSNMKGQNIEFSSNTVDIAQGSAKIELSNCLFGSTTEINGTVTASGYGGVYSNKHDQIADAHYNAVEGGVIQSTTAVRHTATGIAWQLMPTSTAFRGANAPLIMPLAKILCSANTVVTASVWLRRTNTGLTGKLVCRGGQIAGVASEVSSSISAAADTWEQVNINFTPTEAGVVDLEIQAYGGTTYSLYVDDLTVV